MFVEPWYGIHGFWVWIWPCCSYYWLVFLSFVLRPDHNLGRVGQFLVCDVVLLRCSFQFSLFTPRMACTLAVWKLRSFCRRVGDCGRSHSWSRGRESRFRGRYVLVSVVLEYYSRSDCQGTIVGSLFWSLFGGCFCWAFEFAIFAASREMVVHGAHYVPRYRTYLGFRMLWNVEFRQFPQTEDVAKLVFWMGLILGLDLGLSCHLDGGR